MGEVKRYKHMTLFGNQCLCVSADAYDALRAEAYLHEVRLADAYEALELLRAENAELVEALEKETDRLDWVFKNHIYVSWISRPPDHVSQTQYSFCASGSIGRLPPLEGPTFRESIDDEINAEKQATESPRKP